MTAALSASDPFIKEGAVVSSQRCGVPFFIMAVRKHSVRDLSLTEEEFSALNAAVKTNALAIGADPNDYILTKSPGDKGRFAYICVYPKSMAKSEAISKLKALSPSYGIFSLQRT